MIPKRSYHYDVSFEFYLCLRVYLTDSEEKALYESRVNLKLWYSLSTFFEFLVKFLASNFAKHLNPVKPFTQMPLGCTVYD